MERGEEGGTQSGREVRRCVLINIQIIKLNHNIINNNKLRPHLIKQLIIINRIMHAS